MITPCCRFLIGFQRTLPSPFARQVVTGYYDGPTAGLVECGACGTTYSFRMLDWDDQQDLRVFSLSPISGRAVEELMRFPRTPEPRWPVWVLSGEATAEVAARVDELRASASPEEFIVVSDNLMKELAIWRPTGLVAVQDWFIELNLPRNQKI